MRKCKGRRIGDQGLLQLVFYAVIKYIQSQYSRPWGSLVNAARELSFSHFSIAIHLCLSCSFYLSPISFHFILSFCGLSIYKKLTLSSSLSRDNVLLYKLPCNLVTRNSPFRMPLGHTLTSIRLLLLSYTYIHALSQFHKFIMIVIFFYRKSLSK